MAGGVVGMHQHAQLLRGADGPAMGLEGGSMFVVSGLRDIHRVACKEGGHPTDERRGSGGGENVEAFGDLPEASRGFDQGRLGRGVWQGGPAVRSKHGQRVRDRVDPCGQVNPCLSRAAIAGDLRVQIAAVISCFAHVWPFAFACSFAENRLFCKGGAWARSGGSLPAQDAPARARRVERLCAIRARAVPDNPEPD